MAAAVFTSTTTTTTPALQPDSLSHIDISTLSQSELHALSLCSSSAFDLRCSDHLVVPKIDRSLFNESAGSRRQTYSRPQSSPSTSATGHHHRRRIAGLLPSHPKPPPPLAFPSADPDRTENRAIINHLKQLISQDPRFDNIEFSPPSLSAEFGHDSEIPAVLPVDRKRKRGRKPKVKGLNSEAEDGDYGGLEVVNRNGVAVDVSALASEDDPFGEELKRRTAGMESEEALLGFMRELEGQWGSRRKRRRIVDAAEFGDALPVGWKLLLGLKRKEGRAWVYCRRYISGERMTYQGSLAYHSRIESVVGLKLCLSNGLSNWTGPLVALNSVDVSPTGQHFISCKDVSSYLQSVDGLSATHQRSGRKGEGVQDDRLITENQHAGLIFKDGNLRQDTNPSTDVLTPIPNEHGKEVVLFEMENLAEVQIHDLFECHKCDMSFDEKDSYLQHLLSFHQRTTRRYRLGSSVGDGVIIKDGKYECQFCHKVFLERRRYNGHVGIHVRNYVRRVEDVPGPTVQKESESPARDDLPSRISKMDALIEIAQSSILETSAGPDERSKGPCAADKHDAISSPERPPVSNSDYEIMESPLCEQEADEDMIDQDHLNQQDNDDMVTDGSMKITDGASEIVDVKMDSCLDETTLLSSEEKGDNSPETFTKEDSLAFSLDATEQGGIPKCDRPNPLSENKTKMHDGGNLEQSKPVEVNNIENNKLKCDSDGTIHTQTYDITMESVQKTYEGMEGHREISASSNATSDKRHENETGFEELRLEEIEPLKYSFADGQESDSLQEVPIELANNAEMEAVFGSSVQFESEEVMLDLAARHQLSTVCVWCGFEFNHDIVDSEIQSDSVGFMCPTCKSKISGQVNVLENGSPANPHAL
ncbi:hypothetical protein TIFTF001_018635 [Ficus carica]|uniref:C2H2-type domain-containing protein n=1 Tax=Ficus carica TaxID=3494 RepID=A0AA88A7F6_FICCA|nr:hypothetical protein TIFTF001_018635 [Ficus carica]